MNLSPSLGAGSASFSARMEVPVITPRKREQHVFYGYGYLRTVMEFMRWAHEQDHFPSAEAVRARFNVSKATAYRWTSALAETYGLDPAIRHKRNRQ